MDSTTLAIVGAGSLGQTVAALLAASGQQVTLLATPATADRLLGAGRIRLHGVDNRDVPASSTNAPAGAVGVTATPSALPERCGLIFATKGHQLAAAIAGVRGVWPRAGDAASWVAGVQNGVIKDDMLAEAFGSERVVGAASIVGAQREPDGQVLVTSLGASYLGELSGDRSARVEQAVALLQQAGIPTDAVDDIRSVIWSKACNATGVFGVSVLTRGSAPGPMRNVDLMRAYLALVRETAAIAAAEGVALGDYAGFPIRTYLERPEAETLAEVAQRARAAPARPTGLESLPSMTQDLLAGRPMEVEEVFADVVARAERAGLAVPRLTLVRDLLRGIDPGRKQSAI